MLAARCAQRVLWQVHRRHLSLSRCSWSAWSDIAKNVKGFFTQSEKENFDEEFIRKAYKSDGINEDEWMLIYRDQDSTEDVKQKHRSLIDEKGASRSFFLFGAIFPAFLIGLGVVGYDVCNNELPNRLGFVQRISRDVDEIGLLAIFPATSVVLVVLVLLRMHQLRLLRIYQNRKTVDDFVAVGSQNIVQKHKINFNRDAAAACYFAEEQRDLKRLLTHTFIGNMQIGKRRFLISDDAFRANNYRTYMLNETSIPPRL